MQDQPCEEADDDGGSEEVVERLRAKVSYSVWGEMIDLLCPRPARTYHEARQQPQRHRHANMPQQACRLNRRREQHQQRPQREREDGDRRPCDKVDRRQEQRQRESGEDLKGGDEPLVDAGGDGGREQDGEVADYVHDRVVADVHVAFAFERHGG